MSLKEMKNRLSLLWIFAMFNYLYADVLSLFDADVLKEISTGYAGSIHMTDNVLFGAALLMESAILMVLLSQLLNYRANRIANIIAGILHTVAVFGSAVEETPAIYYAFFAVIEIACTLFIVWYAWQWKNPTAEQPAVR